VATGEKGSKGVDAPELAGALRKASIRLLPFLAFIFWRSSTA
jgi:hypothetical protein